MNNLLRTLLYTTVIGGTVAFGGLAVWEKLKTQENGYALFFTIVTGLLVSLLFGFYEASNKVLSQAVLNQTEFVRDSEAAKWSPAQFEQVKADRLDRDGYES